MGRLLQLITVRIRIQPSAIPCSRNEEPHVLFRIHASSTRPAPLLRQVRPPLEHACPGEQSLAE